MVVYREDGAPSFPQVLSGWVYGRILEKVERLFSSYTRFEVGDRTKISFWHDLWVGNMTLKAAFPALFGIAAAKYAYVANNSEFLGVSFTREAHNWEVNVFASFFQMLHSVTVRRGGEDKLWWVPSKKGLFKVKTFFHSLTRTIGTRFPWKCVWRTQALSRATFFSWSAALGKIITLDNLRKHHAIMINRYYMCKKTEESVDHLLLHCDVVYALWYSLFSRFGLSWVMPRRVIDLLAGGLRAGQGVLQCGKWHPFASFDAYGGKETTETLRMWRRSLKNFYPPSITLCIFGLQLICSHYLLAFMTSLLVSLVRRFLLYTPSVLKGAPRNEIGLLLIKKKKLLK